MRICPLLFVAALTLSVYADASSARSSSTFEQPTRSHQHVPQRYLRDGAEEERAFGNFPESKIKEKAGMTSFLKTNFKNEILPSIKLDTGDNLLKNKKFIEWVEVVRQKKNNPEAFITEVLLSHYTDEEYLEILETFAKKAKTKEWATKLQDGWIQFRTAKTKGKDKYRLIKNLRKLLICDDNVMKSPRFEVYYKLVLQEYKQSGDLYVALQLLDLFGKKNYANYFEMLGKSMKDPDTNHIATLLYDKILGNLFRIRFEPSGLLGKLHNGHDFLSIQGFKVWVKLATRYYKKESPEEDMWMKMTNDMASHYNIDDHELLKMLETFTNDPATEKDAAKLLSALQSRMPNSSNL